MKLYFTPGACSLAPHIVARELGIELELDRVRDKKTSSGEDFWGTNPKGYVPTLKLDDGQILTEGPAITQYLADSKPGSDLAPPNGTFGRVRLQEWLGYINSELHKTYSPLFSAGTPEATKRERAEYLKKRYALVDAQLGRAPFLTGDKFTIADAYLFTVTNWARLVKLDLSDFRHLAAFQERVASRPAVKEAMKAEGLIKEQP
jgi:glutathione S-transferase